MSSLSLLSFHNERLNNKEEAKYIINVYVSGELKLLESVRMR